MDWVYPQYAVASDAVSPLAATPEKKTGMTAAMMVVAKAELAQSYHTQLLIARLFKASTSKSIGVDFSVA